MEMRHTIIQMMACTELDSLRSLVRDNNELILDAGYTRNLQSIQTTDKELIIRALFLHCTIYRSMAELDQLKAGLNVLGVGDEMQRNPSHFVDFFTRKDQKVSAGNKLNVRLIICTPNIPIHNYRVYLLHI